MRNKNHILNPYFLIGLFLLIINDFYLKYEYGNYITGKLSDFAGLLIFPMFIAFLLPKLKKSISLIIGILFIIWKTPLVDPFIYLINHISVIPMHRTVDYSDYIALLILPLSHYLINYHKYKVGQIKQDKIKQCLTYSTLIVSFCAFCATSFPYRELPQGTIAITKSYNIKLPKDSVINSIKKLGYDCTFHQGDSLEIGSYDYYQTNNIVRYHTYNNDSTIWDTIANVKYRLVELNPKKTRLEIINVTLTKEGNIQYWKNLKVLSQQYESWLKKNLIEKVN